MNRESDIQALFPVSHCRQQDAQHDAMNAVAAKIKQELELAEHAYAISTSLARVILFLPIIITSLYCLTLAVPISRPIAYWMLGENHLIELLTFGFLLAGGIQGALLAWQTKNHSEKTIVYGFYAIFSIGILFTAMEEVAWGQWFFGFETPSALETINAQGELTFHNIRGLQGHSEFFHMAFGLGGLLGIWASSRRYFRMIGAPVILMSWFLIICILTAPDLYNDYFSIPGRIDTLVRELDEFAEMLIGMSGLLYVWLNARMFAARWREDAI